MDRHQIASYPLRIPAELRAWLDTKAKSEDRSLQKEIIRRLEQSRQAEQPQGVQQ